MKKLIFYIITFNLQNLIYSIVPLWNFENTAIKLDLPFSYEFTKKDSYGNSLTLKKTIDISENNIIQRNAININNKLKINDAEWENIESFYKYGRIIIIYVQKVNIICINAIIIIIFVKK